MNLQVSITDEQQRKLAGAAAAEMSASGEPCTLQDVVRQLIDNLPDRGKVNVPVVQSKKGKGAQ